MRKLEYTIAVKIQVPGDDTSPVTRLVDQIKTSGGTAEIKTIKPVRQKKETAAPAEPAAAE